MDIALLNLNVLLFLVHLVNIQTVKNKIRISSEFKKIVLEDYTGCDAHHWDERYEDRLAG